MLSPLIKCQLTLLVCGKEVNVVKGDTYVGSLITKDWRACQFECRNRSDCHSWTYYGMAHKMLEKTCKMMAEGFNEVSTHPMKGYMSGPKHCTTF